MTNIDDKIPFYYFRELGDGLLGCVIDRRTFLINNVSFDEDKDKNNCKLVMDYELVDGEYYNDDDKRQLQQKLGDAVIDFLERKLTDGSINT